MLPSAARAISASAASGTSMPSSFTIRFRWSAMTWVGNARNSKTCERDRMVSGILCSSVVAMMKSTCAGGSSIDEQRVERRHRELVHFVDDEDLVAVADRGNRQPGDDDFADVVDAGVAGGVDLEHVHVAALCDLDARVALTAGTDGRPVDAVERPRQDARGRRLAGAALAGKHERMRDPVAAIALRSVRHPPAGIRRRSSNFCGRHLRAKT